MHPGRDKQAKSNGPARLARGRGAGIDPGNRFDRAHLTIDGEYLDELAREHPSGVQVRTSVEADATRSIINHVKSPDLGFNWTINPYRGCEHGCTYCYARPTHETLGYSCGLDFETKIVAKLEAPELLRKELASPRWRGESIVMSGVTDPYQPVETKLRITRRCLEVMAECGQPVSLITKSALITRDLDLLSDLAARGAASAAVSLTTLDPALSATMEPRAASPARRLETIRKLTDAGVPVFVMTAPIIPGVNDHELPALLEAAADAGAKRAGWVLLRLPHQLKDVFLDWMRTALPDRADKVERYIRESHDGALYDATFRARQRGSGPRAAQLKATFDLFTRRYGLDSPLPTLSTTSFRRPTIVEDGQMGLFGAAPQA